MAQCEVEIVNELGVNASACTKLTEVAATYQCDVAITRKGRRVNAKSFMGVMMLAAGKGSRLKLETDGPDEKEALDAIVALIASGFGERVSNADPSSTG